MTEEDFLLWALARGYLSEQSLDGQTFYPFTEAGRAYADGVLAASQEAGKPRWLYPFAGVTIAAWGLARWMRGR